jgi:hypothetical protein
VPMMWSVVLYASVVCVAHVCAVAFEALRLQERGSGSGERSFR